MVQNFYTKFYAKDSNAFTVTDFKNVYSDCYFKNFNFLIPRFGAMKENEDFSASRILSY